MTLLTEIQFDDPSFAHAVALIDAGDVGALRRLLADEPLLVRRRATGDGAIMRGYFTQPTLPLHRLLQTLLIHSSFTS